MLVGLISLAFAGPESELDLQPLPAAERVSVSELPPVLHSSEVPVWPDMRRFRRTHDSALVGLALGTVSAVVLAAALPDRGRLLGCMRLDGCGIPVQPIY